MKTPVPHAPLYRMVVLLVVFVSTGFTSTTFKYPFAADFDMRTALYTLEGITHFTTNLVNPDKKSYDSLEIRFYFRGPETYTLTSGTFARLTDTVVRFEDHCMFIVDIGIKYRSDGFQDMLFKTEIDSSVRNAKPVRIENSFDTATGTWAYSMAVPIHRAVMESGARIRFDLSLRARSPIPPHEDTWTSPPLTTISDADWSFGPHAVADGDLVNFPGVPEIEKNDIDAAFFDLPVNYYFTIHRNDKLLWGIPPDWEKHYDKNTFLPVDTRKKQDPMPYAPIAVPFDEYEEQLVRDSANLVFSPIRINQAGYRPQDDKYFYYIGSSSSDFSVIDTSGTSIGSGTLQSTGQTSSSQLKIKASNNALLVSGGDTRYLMDSPEYSGTIYEGILPELPEGKYRIKVDTSLSAPFIIHHGVYNMVKDALLKFYGVNRCGNSKSWFHAPCHLLDPVTGGWHDCGDHLKEAATMSYTAAVLGLAAAVFSDRDLDTYDTDQSKTVVTDGMPDILYEAKHGADFILQSYDKAQGKVGDMITSVGGFGNDECGDDHAWWGLPEHQENMPVSRGGPPRCARNEPTTDYLGKYAANLAFVSKLMRPHDEAYADRCLTAAKAIYTFTKTRLDITNTPAYNGSTTMSDDIAFGCLALLWATGERTFLDELCYDKAIGSKASDIANTTFTGGWFTAKDPLFFHNMTNTDWSSVQAHVLWGFFRLILSDETLCSQLNLTSEARLALIEKTTHNLITNLSSVGQGNDSIPLPENDLWIDPIIKYGRPWFTMHTQMEWVWNRYQAGNITEMYYYYDIASRIQGTTLPNAPAATDWKAEEVKTVLIRMMDYLLGVNPWDISMEYGIGAKNFNHPHHHAANPELRSSLINYPYRHLVGALQGGYLPSTSSLYQEHADDYFHSEVGIDGTTNLLMPVIGLSSVDYTVGHRIPERHAIKYDTRPTLTHMLLGRTLLVTTSRPIRSTAVYTINGRRIRLVSTKATSSTSMRIPFTSGAGIYLLRVTLQDGTVMTCTLPSVKRR